MPHRIHYPVRLYGTIARYIERNGIASGETCGRMARTLIRDRRNGGKYLRRIAGGIIRRAVQSRSLKRVGLNNPPYVVHRHV